MRSFADILHALEAFSKLSHCFDAEEVSGSNPLSPTLDKRETAHKGKPRFSPGLPFTSSTPTRCYAGSLGVVGTLLFQRVSFEGVIHGAGGRVSHARYHLRVGV